MSDRQIRTERLLLVKLVSNDEGSADLRWFHRVWSNSEATQWRCVITLLFAPTAVALLTFNIRLCILFGEKGKREQISLDFPVEGSSFLQTVQFPGSVFRGIGQPEVDGRNLAVAV